MPRATKRASCNRGLLDGLRRNAGAVVIDGDPRALHGDRDDRRDFVLLGRVQRVVHQLLENDQRPITDIVTGDVHKLPAGAKLHQAGNRERDPLELLLCLFYRPFSRFGLATICKKWVFCRGGFSKLKIALGLIAVPVKSGGAVLSEVLLFAKWKIFKSFAFSCRSGVTSAGPIAIAHPPGSPASAA